MFWKDLNCQEIFVKVSNFDKDGGIGKFNLAKRTVCHFDVRRNHTRDSTKIGDVLCGVSSVISPYVEMTNCATFRKKNLRKIIAH
jgi:hypothetical protein